MASAEKQVSAASIEERELPEEGEIMEDEEEEEIVPVAPKSNNKQSSKSSKNLPPQASGRPAKSLSKYKDYDSVKSMKQLASQDAMLNSWVSGVHKKASGKIIADTDPNEEYYGVASVSGDQNVLEIAQNGATITVSLDDDKDYRERLDGQDSDYRRMAHSPLRQDRRRRHSNSPEGECGRLTKRHKGRDSPPQLTGRFRRNPIRSRWAEHTICKFFREGFCRDGDECAYSHNAADSHRRTELCKYYQHGFCKKGLACLHLHGEYPCKAFQKGECSKEQCQYSHQALDQFTQPIFEQMMRDEELAARVSLPCLPVRRKVLLPLGPETSINESESDQNMAAPPASGGEEYTYGFFNPITPVCTTVARSSPPSPPTTSCIPPVSSSIALPADNTASPPSTQSAQRSPTPKLEAEPVEQEVFPGGFNINLMLEQITQQVNASAMEEVKDSPASPTSFFHETSLFQDTKMIPVIREWKLHEVDVPPGSPIDLQHNQTYPSLKNDPRVKKESENHFGQIIQTRKLATTLLPFPPVINCTSKATKPVDPRTKDPRRKAVTSPPAAAVPLTVHSSAKQQPNHLEELVEKQILMANELAEGSQLQEDTDHRPAYVTDSQTPSQSAVDTGTNAFSLPFLPSNGLNQTSNLLVPASAHPEPVATYTPFPAANYSVPPPPFFPETNDFSRGGAQPQFRRGEKGYDRKQPRDTGWEHPAISPLAVGTRRHVLENVNNFPATTASAEVPLTLRQKRKNNEYESPLARVTSRY